MSNGEKQADGLVAEVVDNGGKRFCMLVDWDSLPVGTKVYAPALAAPVAESNAVPIDLRSQGVELPKGWSTVKNVLTQPNGRNWYSQEYVELLSKPVAEHDDVERAARAMAIHSGWNNWDAATDCTHTLSGNDPDDERDYFRGLAQVALAKPVAAALPASNEQEPYGWVLEVGVHSTFERGPGNPWKHSVHAFPVYRATPALPAEKVQGLPTMEELAEIIAEQKEDVKQRDGDWWRGYGAALHWIGKSMTTPQEKE